MLAGSRQFLKYAAFVGLSRQGRRAYISGLTGISDSDLLMTCLIALSKKKRFFAGRLAATEQDSLCIQPFRPEGDEK